MSAAFLQDDQLESLFDQIPALAGRPRFITELSGGLTNRNLKVTTPDGRFVARCSGLGADAPDIDRDVEYHSSCAAEKAGVGLQSSHNAPTSACWSSSSSTAEL